MGDWSSWQGQASHSCFSYSLPESPGSDRDHSRIASTSSHIRTRYRRVAAPSSRRGFIVTRVESLANPARGPWRPRRGDYRLDALGGLAVILGVSLSKWGGASRGSRQIAVAALGIAATVLWMAVVILRENINDLMDPPGSLGSPGAGSPRCAATVPGVLGVETLRVRKSGLEYLVDIHIEVAATLTVESRPRNCPRRQGSHPARCGGDQRRSRPRRTAHPFKRHISCGKVSCRNSLGFNTRIQNQGGHDPRPAAKAGAPATTDRSP